MKVTTKGQVPLPQHIRRIMGMSAYSEETITRQLGLISR
jgi:bifunctional DNA-binding transcriptional regulator/antitoxin component of YhaV-PrlF toxin-antitoxin module